ncbi:cytidine and dCMP deaminase domain-containing 1-like, partial [Paramuricea clavata]
RGTSSSKAKRGKRTADEAGLPSYAKSYSRVSKDNLYMIIALWMEEFVKEAPEDHNKVRGARVTKRHFILIYIFLTVDNDCSRDGVHAAARLLMKHGDKAKGCKMFMSRKPCPFCAKLLVQSKVERVLTSRKKVNEKRKKSNKTQMNQVDDLFTASSIAQTRFVLQVEKPVLEDAEQKKTSGKKKKQIRDEINRLNHEYGFERNPNWMECIKDELPWPAFDNEIKAEVQAYFANAMEWIARANVLRGRGLNYEFECCHDESKNSDAFNPVSNTTHTKQARHFMAIARFLAERTDDPKTGVGAVIVSPEMEIISFGWNSFPLKAKYGKFPRASKSDKFIVDKKYPYVIHAEQNALLTRNKKKIEGAILFVTKSPCNECAPLIAMQGIETVVVDDDVSSLMARQQLHFRDFEITIKHRLYSQVFLHVEGKTGNEVVNAPAIHTEDKNSTMAESKKDTDRSYAKSHARVSKDNLYMIIALWIEDFDKAPEGYNNVGAVLVLPNDVVCAADCSRDGVHAVARLLMKHCDKAKGCKMFMSRKPCPFCAKLLVQSKVERVLFLPREPEYYHAPKPLGPEFKDDDKKRKEIEKERNKPNMTLMKQVDNMFTASVIAQTRFVLKVDEQVLADSVVKSRKTEAEIKKQTKKDKDKLTRKYGFSREWIGSYKIIEKNLPWPAFDDEVKSEVLNYFDNIMEWMARAIAPPRRELKFEPAIEKTETTDGLRNTTHAEQACHFMTIARFLAERTDDPKTGVGAVIVSPEMEILSFGWNGFPLKALYGEFPRGEKKEPVKKKYPYVIHAEQNALLFRNNKNIKGAILFVTRTPCDECTPLIAMQGIKTFVVDDDVFARDATQGALKYKEFTLKIKNGKGVCFQTKEP